MAKMGRPQKEINKIEFNNLETLFNYRVINNGKNRKTQDKNYSRLDFFERYFCDNLEKELKTILCELGFNVDVIAREFTLSNGRCDFVVKYNDDQILIIECKARNPKVRANTEELRFCYAIGQLQTYRAILSTQYNIPKENIHLMIATDYDNLLLHTVIGFEKLNISCLIVNEDGVKYYGVKEA